MAAENETQTAMGAKSDGGVDAEGVAVEGSAGGASGEDAEPAVDLSPEQQLEAARTEAAENFERFVRARADLDNLHKRHQRELGERARYDGERIVREMLSSIDDLERALKHADESGGVSGGVELVLKTILEVFKRHGIERIDAAGKLFDPAEHEAVAMVETDAAPPNTVVDVFRPGYRMHDRLLRAAMVTVAKTPAGNSANAEDKSADQEETEA